MRRIIAAAVVLLIPLVFMVSPAAAFTDVDDHPYYNAIQELADYEIINGYKDGSFRPDAEVWRQHFAKMIVLTVGLEALPGDQCPFGDVASEWPYPRGYVAAAYQHEITNGKTATSFAPYDSITRAQVVTMTVRALEGYAGLELFEPDEEYPLWGVLAGFNDPIHGHNARLAEYNGLLASLLLDDDGGWDPWAPATRGEVAQMLSNALWLLLLAG